MLAAGWKPDRTIVTITATGAASYTVASDVSIVNSVVFVSGTGTGAVRFPLTRVKPEELNDLITITGSPAQKYDLIGGGTSALTIELYPNPPSGTYEVRYSKRFPGFTNDADNWIGPDGSDELIILTAAIECVNKEEDPGNMLRALEARLKERWAEVIEAAGWVDAQGQQTVRDTHAKRLVPGDYDVSDGYSR